MMASPGTASAPAISVKRLVQSRPLRVKTFFLPRLRWTWIAVAVVLDLVKPLVALGRLGLQCGKLGLNEPRHLDTLGQQRNSQKEPTGSGHLRAVLKNLEQSGDVVFPGTTISAAISSAIICRAARFVAVGQSVILQLFSRRQR